MDMKETFFSVREHKSTNHDSAQLLPHVWYDNDGFGRTHEQLVRVLEHGDLAILITGDTGTGKEGVAQMAIDRETDRGKKCVSLSCPGLTANVADSELFGHKKGAFTGATSDREGMVEIFDFVFLDEIGHLPPETQAKLLRFMQSGEYRRLGDNSVRKTTCRFIAATNKPRDLLHDLRARFEVEIRLPSLSSRRVDIPWLIAHFACVHTRLPGCSWGYLLNAVLQSWPDNTRQLLHSVKRSDLFAGTVDWTMDIPLDVIDCPRGQIHANTKVQSALRWLCWAFSAAWSEFCRSASLSSLPRAKRHTLAVLARLITDSARWLKRAPAFCLSSFMRELQGEGDMLLDLTFLYETSEKEPEGLRTLLRLRHDRVMSVWFCNGGPDEMTRPDLTAVPFWFFIVWLIQCLEIVTNSEGETAGFEDVAEIESSVRDVLARSHWRLSIDLKEEKEGYEFRRLLAQYGITGRKKRVAELKRLRWANKKIGEELGVSRQTVDTDLTEIREHQDLRPFVRNLRNSNDEL